MRLNILLFALLAGWTAVAQTSVKPMKFDFGRGLSVKGYIRVSPGLAYNDSLGYGFDLGTKPEVIRRKAGRKTTNDFVTSTRPFYFSVKLPEGNYNVTVTLGDIKGTSLTTVKAESRRLMLEHIKTAKGEVVTKTFTVNVHTAYINDSLSIKTKPREKVYLNLDHKLTLEFGDSLPCVSSIVITPNKIATTIFLSGNSTVVDQNYEPWAAWGQMLPRFLKPDSFVVANFAESGESLASFKSSLRLKKVLSLMKPGDYHFIEFGHNDQKRKGDENSAWASYSDLLREFVNETRRKGGIPVIVTSMQRRNFNDSGKVVSTLGDFPAAARKVAEELDVPLIDLNQMTTLMYEAWGDDFSRKAFVQYPANTWPGQDKKLEDNTHPNPYGAYEVARCIVYGIKQLGLPLSKYIVSEFGEFDPSKPDDFEKFHWVVSPSFENQKPDGN